MLHIEKKANSFILHDDGIEGSFLNKPLHKIFLKNVLNGVVDINSGDYYIPEGTIDNLLIIINHLKKYSLPYDIDDGCEELLEIKSREESEFKDIITQSLRSKSSIDDVDIEELKLKLLPEFTRILTRKQYQAVNHLLSVKNGANFSVPGSGKTSIALAYYHLLRKFKIVDRLFIIGPASIFEPWESECKACFKEIPRIVRIAGNQKSIRKTIYLTIQKNEVFLNTYHSAARDIKEIKALLKQRNFLLILDESHYVKRPTGGKLSDTILELSKYATRRVILTGTPMPNGLSDLWSQISFLWIDRLPLGTANQYLRKVSTGEIDSTFNLVKAKVNPFFFRITKTQLGLPKPRFFLQKYKLAPLQSLIYRGVAIRFLSELDISNKDKQVLREIRRARSIRLLQIASNPSLLRTKCEDFLVPPFDSKGMDISDIINDYPTLEIPSKILKVVELVENLVQKKEKVIIWSMFVHNLFMLKKLLNQYNPVVIYGGIPYSKEDEVEISRENLINKFKKDPDCHIFIANPAACAESISLHMICHNAIYLDRSFNCAHYIQSMDRIHRLGLSEHDIINYYILVAEDTVDEVVDMRLNQKIENLNNLLEGELPGAIPGYWSNDLGDEEDSDYDFVDNHIRQFSR